MNITNAQILAALQRVVGMAKHDLEEDDSGIAEGIYDKDGNPELEENRKALELIESMVETIATGELPVAVIQMHGSSIACVNSTIPMRVITMDGDCEDGDPEYIRQIHGDEYYVTDWTLDSVAERDGKGGCDEGIYPEMVKSVVAQIAE